MEIAAGRAGSVSQNLRAHCHVIIFFFVGFRELHRGEEYL